MSTRISARIKTIRRFVILTCLIVLIRVPWLKIAKAINIINFVLYFPDEESCEVYLKAYR
jgi:hypothetical protein